MDESILIAINNEKEMFRQLSETFIDESKF